MGHPEGQEPEVTPATPTPPAEGATPSTPTTSSEQASASTTSSSDTGKEAAASSETTASAPSDTPAVGSLLQRHSNDSTVPTGHICVTVLGQQGHEQMQIVSWDPAAPAQVDDAKAFLTPILEGKGNNILTLLDPGATGIVGNSKQVKPPVIDYSAAGNKYIFNHLPSGG